MSVLGIQYYVLIHLFIIVANYQRNTFELCPSFVELTESSPNPSSSSFAVAVLCR